MEQRKIDDKNVDELLSAINRVVMDSVNTKSISDNKHKKADNIQDTLEKEWSNYIEATLLSGFIKGFVGTDELSPNGKQIFNQLSAKAGKKDSYFINFKKSIETQKVGFYAKYTPSSRSKISINSDRELILSTTDKRGESFSIESSLRNPKFDVIRRFDDLSGKLLAIDYGKESEQQEKKFGADISKDYEVIKQHLGVEKRDFISTSNLEAIKDDVYNDIRIMVSFEEKINNINRYMYYFSPETRTVLNNFIKELNNSITNLETKVSEAVNSYRKEAVKVSEKAFGKLDIERLIALMAMVEREVDSRGNKLPKETLEEYKRELEEAKKTNPIAYQEALNEYNMIQGTIVNRIHSENKDQAMNVVPDEGLSHDDLKERNHYYERLVVDKQNNDIISRPLFNEMYDRYLRLDIDDPYALETIVHYYLEYYDYCNDMRRRAEQMNKPVDLEYKNWQDYVEKRMQEEGYKFGTSGRGR